MVMPSIDYTVAIKITLASRAAAAVTQDIVIANRAYLGNNPFSAQFVYPILLSCSDIGAEADLYLPAVDSGEFTIDDSVGSFGYQRKFSDLLERYTVHEQAIRIYLVENAIGTKTYTLSASNQVFVGKIENWSRDQSGIISFAFSGNQIPDKPASYTVPYTTANSPASGKTLPLGFGTSVLMAGVYYNYHEATPGHYSYGQYFLGTDTGENYATACNASDFWIRDSGGDWVHITSDYGPDLTQGGATDGAISMQSQAGIAWALEDFDTYNAAFWGVRVEMDPNGTGAHNSTMVLYARIYTYNKTTKAIIEEVGGGSVNMSDYNASNNGASKFYAYIYFDETIVCDSSKWGYAISFSQSGFTTGDADITTRSATTFQSWSIGKTAAVGSDNTYEFVSRGAQASPYFQRWCELDLVDAYGTLTGIGLCPHYIRLTHDQYTPRDLFSNIELATHMNAWDARPDLAMSAVLQGIGSWDFDTLAATYATRYATSGTRTRTLNGYIEGEHTIADVLEQICKDSASRVGVNNSGQYFPWPWGGAATIADTIPAQDLNPLAWEEADSSSVVNYVTLKYGKTPLNVKQLTSEVTESGENWNGALEWEPTDGGLASYVSQISRDLYGVKQAEQTEADLISSDTAANTLAEYLASAYAKPTAYASFEVSYSTYKALKMFDVINFAHPEFPAHFGTAGESFEAVSTGATASANLWEGHRHFRAQTYRGLIEGRWLALPIEGGAPRIRLRVRVLNNYPTDPT